MEKELLYQVRLTTDMIRQLEEQVRTTLSTEYQIQDVETQNAVNNLFSAFDNLRWQMAAHINQPAPGSSGTQQGVQTTCPRCKHTVTVVLT